RLNDFRDLTRPWPREVRTSHSSLILLLAFFRYHKWRTLCRTQTSGSHQLYQSHSQRCCSQRRSPWWRWVWKRLSLPGSSRIWFNSRNPFSSGRWPYEIHHGNPLLHSSDCDCTGPITTRPTTPTDSQNFRRSRVGHLGSAAGREVGKSQTAPFGGV